MNTRNDFRRLVRMTVLVVALLPLTALAQAARLQMPDFSGLTAKATESVDIDLSGDTLKSALGFMSGSNTDPQLAEQLKGLESITVKVFSFKEPGVYSTKDIEGVVKQVETKGWKKLLSVRDKDERVEMWLREGNADGGMFFVASEPKELVMINIAGKVDLATLTKLQGRLGVPNMGIAENLGLGGGGRAPAPPAPAAPPAPVAPPAPPAPPAPAR
jgi:hypothetical protein